MSVPTFLIPSRNLARLGLRHTESVHYQSAPEMLVQQSIRLHEGKLSSTGALVIHTGEFTGRAPKDRYIIYDEVTGHTVDWNEFNLPLDKKYFDIIFKRVTDHLNDVPELWIRDCFACADKRYRLNIRLITDKPWISLFACNMFLRPAEEELERFKPEWHVITVPNLKLVPEECGIRHQNAVVISFEHKMILIAGTGYTGEIKKSVFTILNFLLPQEKNVLPMHCSANKGKSGDTALFFGLSGTGKTTLSAEPGRYLIGDDEHGWADNSIFNFEGGCYAKTFRLSREKEPELFEAIRPGALVENVTFFAGTNEINFDDGSITENGRVSYPIHFISNAAEPSEGNIPGNIFFLTADAFGVLPPISRLTPRQAMYQFISGYTAKLAGTESDIMEPAPTFSACFGAPFLPLHPGLYAGMLGKKLKHHNVTIWLVNTGWTGGPYGTGKRIQLSHTRALIAAALEGKLDSVATGTDAVFGLAFPVECAGVPSEILNPKSTWADKNAYDEQANHLAQLFTTNFEKYIPGVSPEVLEAAPLGKGR